jgi:hypothetical protein|tara:strand:- start:114 stop:578 length:465 start_codon:yes stop_codon:yes gene_type:complete
MRSFDKADRKKKSARIQLQENPGNLSNEVLCQLEDMVKASLKGGYLPCAVAFKIAKETQVPKIAVGEMIDRLGIRITNCQTGCFKVDKTIHDNSTHENVDDRIVSGLNALKEINELTCANVFDLAEQLKSTPMAIADVANLRNLKIYSCQLGCW